jgi:hypothetical protein
MLNIACCFLDFSILLCSSDVYVVQLQNVYEIHTVYFFSNTILLYRYVHQGKGMLQRHQLLAEFDALFESDKEKYAPFEDILRAAQVTSTTFLTSLLAN